MACKHWQTGMVARSEAPCPYCENGRLREVIITLAAASIEYASAHAIQLLDALNDRPVVSGEVIIDKCVRHPTTLAEQAIRAQQMLDELVPNAQVTSRPPTGD